MDLRESLSSLKNGVCGVKTTNQRLKDPLLFVIPERNLNQIGGQKGRERVNTTKETKDGSQSHGTHRWPD
jgi:hypothetical protein